MQRVRMVCGLPLSVLLFNSKDCCTIESWCTGHNTKDIAVKFWWNDLQFLVSKCCGCRSLQEAVDFEGLYLQRHCRGTRGSRIMLRRSKQVRRNFSSNCRTRRWNLKHKCMRCGVEQQLLNNWKGWKRGWKQKGRFIGLRCLYLLGERSSIAFPSIIEGARRVVVATWSRSCHRNSDNCLLSNTSFDSLSLRVFTSLNFLSG